MYKASGINNINKIFIITKYACRNEQTSNIPTVQPIHKTQSQFPDIFVPQGEVTLTLYSVVQDIFINFSAKAA